MNSSSADLPWTNGWARLRWAGSAALQAHAEIMMIAAPPVRCLLICNRPSTEIISSIQLPSIRPAQEFYLPVTIAQNRQTALALVNPSATNPVQIKLTLSDESGKPAALGFPADLKISLHPRQRTSQFLWQLYVESSALTVVTPFPERFHGSLRIAADAPVVASAIHMLFPEGKYINAVAGAPPF